MFGYLDRYNMALQAMADKIKELEAENTRLRQQRDAANAVIQEQNRIIAGDTE